LAQIRETDLFVLYLYGIPFIVSEVQFGKFSLKKTASRAHTNYLANFLMVDKVALGQSVSNNISNKRVRIILNSKISNKNHV
jgi:hypothetical protein